MIVVDSAAVVDALTVAPGSEYLRAELTAEELHAPTLLDFEIVSALRGLTLGGQLSTARAQADCPQSFVVHTLDHMTTTADGVVRMFEANGAGLGAGLGGGPKVGLGG